MLGAGLLIFCCIPFAVPPVAQFCFIVHQKDRMLRTLSLTTPSACGLEPEVWNSCEKDGITEGTSSKQMSKIKKDMTKKKLKRERGGEKGI